MQRVTEVEILYVAKRHVSIAQSRAFISPTFIYAVHQYSRKSSRCVEISFTGHTRERESEWLLRERERKQKFFMFSLKKKITHIRRSAAWYEKSYRNYLRCCIQYMYARIKIVMRCKRRGYFTLKNTNKKKVFFYI